MVRTNWGRAQPVARGCISAIKRLTARPHHKMSMSLITVVDCFFMFYLRVPKPTIPLSLLLTGFDQSTFSEFTILGYKIFNNTDYSTVRWYKMKSKVFSCIANYALDICSLRELRVVNILRTDTNK